MNREEFANRLVEIMEEQNRTDRDISLKIGRDPGYINGLINKKTYPRMEYFFDICEELGVSPSEFFDTENKYPDLVNRVIPYFKKLNKKEFIAVETFLETITGKK